MRYKKGLKHEEKIHDTLELVLTILDAFTKLFFHIEIVITSLYRPPGGTKSFHHKIPVQAADMRTRDLEPLVITFWGVIISFLNKYIKVFNITGKLDLVEEQTVKDENGNIIKMQHAHLEYDTGDPE